MAVEIIISAFALLISIVTALSQWHEVRRAQHRESVRICQDKIMATKSKLYEARIKLQLANRNPEVNYNQQIASATEIETDLETLHEELIANCSQTALHRIETSVRQTAANVEDITMLTNQLFPPPR